MIRVLVAEDSSTTRELLVALLGSDPEIRVVGEARNGAEAVARTRDLRPDVVAMDARMPVMDGFEATRRIMIETPTPIVIVTASLDPRDVGVSMNALRAGALTIVAKPNGPGSSGFEEARRRFVDAVRAMASVKVVRRWPDRAVSTGTPAPPGPRPAVRARVLAMAASAGGPAALSRVLADLPGSFPAPVLVVQHMATGFMQGFATWLDALSSLPVRIAEDREPLRAGTVHLAPDGFHLGVTGEGVVSLSDAPAIDGFRPSASHLFRSVARAFGGTSVAVVLTGMGQDGVEGLRAVREAGGYVIAQDEETSVVFGMPGAAIASGCVQAVLPLHEIPRRLKERFEQGG